MSPHGHIYAEINNIDNLFHSTFLAGGAVAMAGLLSIQNRHYSFNLSSGHYRQQHGPQVAMRHLHAELQARGANMSFFIFDTIKPITLTVNYFLSSSSSPNPN